VSQNTELRFLGCKDYLEIWRQMQQFTADRTESTPDEIWITEHPAVYTLGMNGKIEHLLKDEGIPLVCCDRGGQISYHGPGQLIIYLLANLKRRQLGPRQIVSILENAVLETLKQYGLQGHSMAKAPGVYINGKKIAAIGLRIKHGCCYHGLSFNNNMDLKPFSNINPCGYTGLETTQLADFGIAISHQELAIPVIHQILKAIEP
jgi:lipoyl(octanoyl) transferase